METIYFSSLISNSEILFLQAQTNHQNFIYALNKHQQKLSQITQYLIQAINRDKIYLDKLYFNPDCHGISSDTASKSNFNNFKSRN